MRKQSLGLLVLTMLFSFGCATADFITIPESALYTDFEQTRTSLPERHLKLHVLPVVDLREDKTNFLGTHTHNSIWGARKLRIKSKSGDSPSQVMKRKLTEFFNSMEIFWVEKTKANALLKLSLKKMESNTSEHPFGLGLDSSTVSGSDTCQSGGMCFKSEAKVEFDLEIITANGGVSIFKKTLSGSTDDSDIRRHEGNIHLTKGNILGIAIQKAMRKIRPYELVAVAEKLNPRFAKENKRQQQPSIKPSQEPSPKSGTGSGFFVSKMGHVITNAHVVKNCKKITIGDNANKQVPAEVVNADKSNDLALLKLSTLEMASAESKSLIQKLSIVVVPLASKGLLRSEDVKLGEKILVAGYPFGDAFSNSIKVTTGVVSSIRGVGDDSGQFQLDAAVQPGNSGGPIYDSSGNIVGVVISQLNKRTFGSLVENVNFGVKASTVRQFLVSSGLSSKKSERTEEKSTEQLAEIAKNQALMVMCLQ
jgi:S1-C subfamily serine protease